jgi:hypothetical protein
MRSSGGGMSGRRLGSPRRAEATRQIKPTSLTGYRRSSPRCVP